MLAHGRERERDREREKGNTAGEESGAVIQGLSVNSDNASPRWLETEITAEQLETLPTAFGQPTYSSSSLRIFQLMEHTCKYKHASFQSTSFSCVS